MLLMSLVIVLPSEPDYLLFLIKSFVLQHLSSRARLQELSQYPIHFPQQVANLFDSTLACFLKVSGLVLSRLLVGPRSDCSVLGVGCNRNQYILCLVPWHTLERSHLVRYTRQMVRLHQT